MFNDKQNQVLAYEIDSGRVKSRSKGNINLSYLEGHDLLSTANRIFGYGNWSYNITSLEHVSQEQNSNQNTIICYKATVTITVHDLQHSKQVNREDVGFGTGIAKTLADAHERGAKEAVTDAVKRTFRSFGNQFGNSLYNKNYQPQSQQQTAQIQQSQQQYQQSPNNQVQNNGVVQQHSHNAYDYSALYALGLELREENGELLILGETYGKQDTIKAVGGFRWDSNRKLWYKVIQQNQAA